METFIVVMDSAGAEQSPLVKERLKKEFNEFYEISPTSFLVSADVLTEDVAVAAGIRGEESVENATGAVFKIASYAGYTRRALWEWLGKVGA